MVLWFDVGGWGWYGVGVRKLGGVVLSSLMPEWGGSG